MTRQRSQSLWRQHILNHDQFEELSALAAVGEISHDDWQRLKSHLEECGQCRSVFADVGEIHAKWLPEDPDFGIPRDVVSDQQLPKTMTRVVSKKRRGVAKRDQ